VTQEADQCAPYRGANKPIGEDGDWWQPNGSTCATLKEKGYEPSYWTAEPGTRAADPQRWLQAATRHDGSW
jgi:hypothetical protein